MDDITLDEAVAVEHAGWDSLCESTGGTFYGRLMLPDAVFVLANGMVMTRDDVASSMDGVPGWDSYEISNARLIPIEENSAALVYQAEASRAGLAEPVVALMSSVYRRVGGELRLALYQQTTITH